MRDSKYWLPGYEESISVVELHILIVFNLVMKLRCKVSSITGILARRIKEINVSRIWPVIRRNYSSYETTSQIAIKT